MSLLRQATAFTAIVAALLLAGCSASKGGGGGDGSPTGPSTVVTAKVRASDALSGAAVAGASVSGSGLTSGTTDSSGSLTLTTSTSSTYGIDVSSPLYVTRNTLLKIPGADASVSLIANAFELTPFNEMFRNMPLGDGTYVPSGLQRWTSAPALRIVPNVVEFTTGPNFTVTGEVLTTEEQQGILADLAYGLPLLTGSVFAGFSATTTMSVSPGQAVTLLTEGSITFARCSGLRAARGSAGYGQWLFRSDDVVVGGMVCVDRQFELDASPVGRGVRLHELGHALGYQHITATVKNDVLMNPTISVNDVTTWDRSAARIAFQRPAGNRAPDRDPSSFSTNRLTTRRVMTVDGCRVRR